MTKIFDRHKIAERIKAAIDDASLIQKEMAAQLGVSENTLSNYVRGKRIPDAIVFGRIASILGVTVQWLLTGQGERYEDSLPVGASMFLEVVEVQNQLKDYTGKLAKIQPQERKVALKAKELIAKLGNLDFEIEKRLQEIGPALLDLHSIALEGYDYFSEIETIINE